MSVPTTKNNIMTTPGIKRPLRSRDQQAVTTARLTKPFRSPLIKSSSASSAAAPPETLPANHKAKSSETSESNHATASDSKSLKPDLAVDDLYKQYTDLSRQLTQMRQSLDTAQQSLNILKTNQQQSISNLTERWTAVVRDTAEELFEYAKAHNEVDGGRSRSRQRSPWFDRDTPILTEEQVEMLRNQQEEDRAQAVKYGLIESIEEPADSSEDTSYTMATMLRQMGIDLDLVGYDEKDQCFAT